MPDSKISGLTTQTTVHDADLVPMVDTTDTTQSAQGTTKKTTWTTIKNFLKTYFDGIYANLSGSTLTSTTLTSPVINTGVSGTAIDTDGTLSANSDTKIASQKAVKTYTDTNIAVVNTRLSNDLTESTFDFVASGCVWSGDAYASTRNASMTSGVVYIGGARVSVGVVTARAFTASKDTYIDVNNAGTITYTEVTNNATSPALTASNVRLGIIVTGATTIAAAGSVNQGQETIALPIASSIAYSVTDSLGNLICPRDPNRKILGYRTGGSLVTSSAGPVAIVGLSCPVIVPTGRKIKATITGSQFYNSGTAQTSLYIYEGATSNALTTQVSATTAGANSAGGTYPPITSNLRTPSSSNIFYTGAGGNGGSGTSTLSGMILIIELV